MFVLRRLNSDSHLGIVQNSFGEVRQSDERNVMPTLRVPLVPALVLFRVGWFYLRLLNGKLVRQQIQQIQLNIVH